MILACRAKPVLEKLFNKAVMEIELSPQFLVAALGNTGISPSVTEYLDAFRDLHESITKLMNAARVEWTDGGSGYDENTDQQRLLKLRLGKVTVSVSQERIAQDVAPTASELTTWPDNAEENLDYLITFLNRSPERSRILKQLHGDGSDGRRFDQWKATAETILSDPTLADRAARVLRHFHGLIRAALSQVSQPVRAE